MGRPKIPPPRAGDVELAHSLLSGVIEGAPLDMRAVRYLTDEREARQALVRLLLDTDQPLEPRLRRALAGLFYPDAHPSARTLKFAFRGKQRREDIVRDASIGFSVGWATQKQGMSVEEAVASVAGRCGLGEDRVWQIWKMYKKALAAEG
jgi:hypothetical protein